MADYILAAIPSLITFLGRDMCEPDRHSFRKFNLIVDFWQKTGLLASCHVTRNYLANTLSKTTDRPSCNLQEVSL